MEFTLSQDLIVLRQYATFRQRITILQVGASPGQTGVPLNITGYTFISQVRVNKSDVNPIATLTVTIIDAVNGVVELFLNVTGINSAFTAANGALWGFFDLSGTAPAGGDTSRFDEGIAQLSYGVSHP